MRKNSNFISTPEQKMFSFGLITLIVSDLNYMFPEIVGRGYHYHLLVSDLAFSSLV